MATTGLRISKDLADYHAVVAADIKDFTQEGNTDADHRILARRLPEVLGEAFERSGLDFSRVKFPGQAGDGYAAGIDYHKLPHLICPLLDRLQDVLAEIDARALRRDPRMRLRASIHIGPLASGDDPEGPAGMGRAMNDLHRLLDAAPVRDALRHTDPDTTFVAAVISQRAYEDAVQSGACALPASLLTPIPVHVKQFTGSAWLYVPQPSGLALHRAFADATYQESVHPAAAHSIEATECTPVMPTSGAPAPTFHIGTAGQVAGTVTAPVTIHQTGHLSDRMAFEHGIEPQPDTGK